MSGNYDGSSDNYYGKGRSKGNRNGGSSSRKDRSANGDSKPELHHKNQNKTGDRPENPALLSKRYNQELHSIDRKQESLGDKFDNCWNWSKARPCKGMSEESRITPK